MRRHAIIALLLFPLLLLSCGGGKGKLRIDAHLDNIDQANLLIISPDGGLDQIDTLYLHKGRGQKELNVEGGPYIFVLLYPNLSTLQFMAREGQRVKIRGDVQQYGQERITGCDSIIRVDSVPQRPSLRVGQRMPQDSTLLSAKQANKYLLLAFWANWKSGGSSVTQTLRQALAQRTDSLTALSYSLDVDYKLYNAVWRGPNVTWQEHCDFLGMESPLFRKLRLNNIPYYLLYGPDSKLIAHGNDYHRDVFRFLPQEKAKE